MKNLISIICTTYNEEKLIAKTLESFINQEKDGFDTEILVVDGFSIDSTREIVKSYCEKYSNVKLIDNPERKNPFGRNLGVQNANGNYIALMGGHTVYKNDYLKTCLEEMKIKNADGVGGKVITCACENTSEAQIIELLLTSKFGVSASSFRTIKEGFTNMINFPVFKKEVFEKVGVYDTRLIRNQDNDFNARAEEAGFKLYSTWKTECYYYPDDTFQRTLYYAYRNGFWNAKSFLKNSAGLKLYHYAPFFFVTALIFFGILSFFSVFFFILFFGLFFLHLLSGFIFAMQIKKYKSIKNILSLPFLFFAFHFSYGWGTLKGFFSNKI